MPMGCFYKYPRGIVLSVCPYGRKEEANPEGRLYKLIGVGSALLVLLYWAMREPRSMGRVTDTDLPRFFVIVFHQEYHHADAGRSIGILLF